MLVFVTGDQEGHFGDAQMWYESANSVLQRLGGHDLLRAWLLNNLGCAYAVHHDTALGVRSHSSGDEGD